MFRARFVSWMLLVFFILALVACGGGGGSSAPNLPSYYSGNTNKATIDQDNYEEIALSAYGGSESIGLVSFMSVDEGAGVGDIHNSSLVTFSSILYNIISGLDLREESSVDLNSYLPKQMQSETFVEYGSCGGSVFAEINIDEKDKISGYFNYYDYCDGTFSADGSMSIEGNYSDTEVLRLRISTNDLLINGNYRVMGDMEGDLDLNSSSLSMSLDIVYDSLSDDVSFYYDYSVGYVQQNINNILSIDGRFYHSRYGYVDVDTVESIRYDYDFSEPVAGLVEMTGANSSWVRLEFTSSGQKMTTSFDSIENISGGDGANDIYTGTMFYEGTSTALTHLYFEHFGYYNGAYNIDVHIYPFSETTTNKDGRGIYLEMFFPTDAVTPGTYFLSSSYSSGTFSDYSDVRVVENGQEYFDELVGGTVTIDRSDENYIINGTVITARGEATFSYNGPLTERWY